MAMRNEVLKNDIQKMQQRARTRFLRINGPKLTVSSALVRGVVEGPVSIEAAGAEVRRKYPTLLPSHAQWLVEHKAAVFRGHVARNHERLIGAVI